MLQNSLRQLLCEGCEAPGPGLLKGHAAFSTTEADVCSKVALSVEHRGPEAALGVEEMQVLLASSVFGGLGVLHPV